MKEKIAYVCQQCGQAHSKWVGRCPQCGEWNSVAEERLSAQKAANNLLPGISDASPPKPITQVASERFDRIPSGISELDTTLGGGLVPGSVVLLGGEPGIGKSTILLQAAAQYANNQNKVLYVSGEESPSQIALRSNRLKITAENLLVVSETCLEIITSHIEKVDPAILVIDSIQTMYSSELDSQPGTVGQLRECSHKLIALAKRFSIPTFLVGHVTKEGSIAGPKILEHMVDVVLYFEGGSSHSFRLLRAIKNRFGSTNEVGVFEMASEGMREVTNPSELFLSERPETVPGSVIVGSLEGTRPILVEVQALVSHSTLAIPRRTAIGIDPNRVTLLVAILEKRAGFKLYDQDVYVNVAGGLRLSEPATDLGVVAAVISSFAGKSLENEGVFFGEVGLGGEIRSVPQVEARLKEAKRIGFKRAFIPKGATKELRKPKGFEVVALSHVGQLSDFM